MKLHAELQKASLFQNLELLASQVVEGFISGIHKSPFHGFSAEFSEHKIYNKGENTKHIDWKLFAKTDKLYTKKYEEETNLRCHMILDNSASMYYPEVKELGFSTLNKIGFSALAIAVLMHVLKKQRDAVGLSVYSSAYHNYYPEKGSERHYEMLLAKLGALTTEKNPDKETKTYTYLHEIAENLKRRSMVFLFTDLFQSTVDNKALFDALRHLKHNKHQVTLFHVLDKNTELHFNFTNTPKRFVDVETGAHIDLYADTVKANYQNKLQANLEALKMQCAQYKIRYVGVDVAEGFSKVLNTFLAEKHKF